MVVDCNSSGEEECVLFWFLSRLPEGMSGRGNVEDVRGQF